MNGKNYFYKIINFVFKIIIYSLIIFVIYKGSIFAYEFGFSVFTEEPVDQDSGRDVTITIMKGQSAYDIGDTLQSSGLIEDSKVFWAREFLSEYHGKLSPGIYTLNTSMTMDEMMKMMSREEESENK